MSNTVISVLVKMKKYLKKKNQFLTWLKIWRKTNKYIITLKVMVEENIRQEFRLKNIDETRNYFNRHKPKWIEE